MTFLLAFVGGVIGAALIVSGRKRSDAVLSDMVRGPPGRLPGGGYQPFAPPDRHCLVCVGHFNERQMRGFLCLRCAQ